MAKSADQTPDQTPVTPLTPALITNTLMIGPLATDAEAAQAAPVSDTIVAFVLPGFQHAAAAPLFRHTYLLDPARENATATGLTQSMLDHIIAEVAGAARGRSTRVYICEPDSGLGQYIFAPIIAAFLLAALSGLAFDHVWSTYLLPALGGEATFTPAQHNVVQTALDQREHFLPLVTAPVAQEA